MVIARGFSLDGTQIGFYGTHQQVLRQRMEAEEGLLNAQRWPSDEHRTPPNQFQISCKKSRGKTASNRLQDLAEKGAATFHFVLCTQATEPPCEDRSLITPNVKLRDSPASGRVPLQRRVRCCTGHSTTTQIMLRKNLTMLC